jgi:cell division cycle protein 20 (cofactor of APC complex)
MQTIPLNTSIFSLQWSPYCKELLSTHGQSFTPLNIPRRCSNISGGNASRARLNQKLTCAHTPLTNSITVHEWPSGKRLMTLTDAHRSAVTDSCLGPTGESIFTVCPQEELIKLWKVWSQRPTTTKKESGFDRFTIR